MPRGAHHIETGTLRCGQWGYALHMDGGGIWELDVIGSPRKLLGRRVMVEGTRAGFNLLDVTRIWPAGEQPPAPGALLSLLRRVALIFA